MKYRIRLPAKAERYLQRLPPEHRRRISERLDAISEAPIASSKRLAGGSGMRAARVGRWRIIFAINEDAGTVDIDSIGPRGDIYKDL